ncbi:MAG TPA: PKD-like domain-containing protein, partial [Bacteroidales bacterium]|nr:PKD-like domain-containing protein [Bacteroidales bacterium]
NLDVNETWTYRGTYTITQNDIDAGEINNTAYGQASYGENVTEDSDELTITADQNPSLSVSKVVDLTEIDAPATLNYTITITNTGNVSLTNIIVRDDFAGGAEYLSGDVNNNDVLDIGEAWTYTATHEATQEDVNAGSDLVNIVIVNTDQTGSAQDQAVTTINHTPAMVISKEADRDSYSQAGETITYTIVVTNTGNVTLTNITITDPLTALNELIGELTPGGSESVTTTYVVSQSDLNAGLIENTATARYRFAGVAYSATASETVTANQTAAWTLTKSAVETSFDRVGDVIHYNITIDNTGNVSISNIVVSDPGADPGSIRYISGDVNRNNRLDPPETWRYTATYTVTQADIDAGQYTNTATANGNPPSGTIDSAWDTETVPPIQIPELTVTKSTTVTSFVSAGEEIDYEITVTNTGNVTISGVEVSDPNADVNCSGAPYTLAPGAVVTCTATHIVTASDITEGSISNTATATGYAPNNDRVTGLSNTVIVPLNNLPPEISCPAPVITSTSDTSCDILISEGLSATFSDPNDNIATLTWTMTGATIAESDDTGINNITSYTFNLGETVVTYTVTDALGLSASCSFTVTVSDDTPPVALCRDITVVLDINTGTATITPADINNNSFDNCGIASITIDRTDFDCTDLGPNNVTLTVIDNSGNVGSCTAIVTVNYAVNPNPAVTPSEDIICNGETINLELTSQIPATTWTWTVNSPAGISGASDDPGGLNNSINQTIYNSTRIAHQLIYNIRPQVYGACELEHITASVWVNPIPQIEVGSEDTVLCYGDATVINITNMNPMVRGQWVYELIVMP